MASVKYSIKGSADNSAIDKAKSGLLSLGEGVNKLNTLFNAFVGLKVIQQFGKAVSDTTKAFGVQQQALAQLTNAINNNVNLTAGSMKRLVDFSSQLQKKGIFGDEEIQKQASYLASLGLTEDKIKGVLEASTQLAASGIMPLDAAVKNMAKQFGGMAGELGEKIPALRTLTAEQLKAGEGIALVQKQFAGAMETAAQTLEGKTQRMNNVVGDIKEKIGALFGVAQMKIFDALQPVMENIDAWFEKNIPKIINFFINLPQIGKLALSAISEMLKVVFTIDFWINYFKAVGSLGIQAFKSIFSVAWSIISAIGTALWEPLKYGFELLIADIKFVFSKMVNMLISGFEFIVNGAIGGLNKLIDAANKIPGINIGKVGNVSIDKMNESYAKPTFNGQAVTDAFKNIGTTFVSEISKVGQQWKESAESALAPLTPIVEGVGQEISNVLNQELPPSIQNALNPVVESLTKAGETTTNIVSSGTGPNIMGDMSFLTLLKEFVQPLTDMIGSLSSIKMIMDPLSIVFKAIFDVLKPIIDSLLRPLIGIFRIIGETIGKVLAPLLIQLSPIIELISKAFVFLYNYAIRPLANSIIWVISTIYNMVSNMVNAVIRALNNIPFVNIGWRMSTMDYDAMKLQKITESDLNSAGDRAGVGSVSGGQSASYSGQRDITNNINIDKININGNDREAALKFLEEIKGAIKLGLASY